MAALGMVKETLVFLMARSEGYLGSKIDQKTHPRNQNQVHRAATSFLAGETVGFCADAHAGPEWFYTHKVGLSSHWGKGCVGGVCRVAHKLIVERQLGKFKYCHAVVGLQDVLRPGVEKLPISHE